MINVIYIRDDVIKIDTINMNEYNETLRYNQITKSIIVHLQRK